MNLIIKIASSLILLVGVVCLSTMSSISDGPSWANDYWAQVLHWYGAGLVIIGVIFFLEGFILKTFRTKSKLKYLLLLLVIIISLIAFVGSEILFPYIYPLENDSAIGMLKTLVSCEDTWRQQDFDRNGIKDYWTYDVSCFHRMYHKDKETKVNFIDIAFAKADGAPRVDANIFGSDLTLEDWSSAAFTTAKRGYYYRAMLTDEDGNPYNQNEVGEKKIKATNSNKFAFVAYPAVYGTTGLRTFIVNELGHIYGTDCRSDANKIILHWPGKDPTKVKGPGGTFWQIAE